MNESEQVYVHEANPNRILTHVDDAAVHIDSWDMHEVILAVAEGGQFFSRNAVSGNLDLWVLSEADRIEALAKYGLGGTLKLEWVVKAFKPHLAPH